MSILTKEVIQKILNDDWLLMDDCEGLENCTVIKELARMALAAMDSEPVAWAWHHSKQWHITNDEERVRDLVWDGVKVEPLYRHAQQPVVQENSDPRDAFEAAFPMPKHAQRCGDGYVVTSYGAWTAYEFVKKWEGWNAFRAAMLNGGKS